MQPKPGQFHVANGWRRVKSCEKIPQLPGMFRVYTAGVILLEKPFQPLVADCLYYFEPGRACL